MGCASGIAKYVLFVFNLICALAGLGLLIIGVLFKLNVSEFTDAIPEKYAAVSLVPTLLIVVGSVVFVIAFFGCCGAVKESTCMLTTYAIILLVMLILQIALGVGAFLLIRDNDDLKASLREDFRKLFDKYNDSSKPSNEIVDGIQQALQCCGVDGPTDWINSPFLTVPKSCCKDVTTSVCTPVNSFSQGCVEAMFSTTKDVLKIIGIVVVSIAGVELIGAIFALCLSSSIKNQYRRGAYA